MPGCRVKAASSLSVLVILLAPGGLSKQICPCAPTMAPCSTSPQTVTGALPTLTADALCSLCGLSRLRHVDFSIESLSPTLLTLVASGLPHLRHCAVRQKTCQPRFLSAFLPLVTLTQLTHLQLPDVLGSKGAHRSAAVCGVTAELIVSLRHLGRVTQLQTLLLGDSFHVSDVEAAALQRLPLLAHLQVCSLQHCETAHGILSTLQHLEIRSPLRASYLLRTLRPLLPLPSLTSMTCQAEQQEGDRFLRVHSGWDSLRMHVGCDSLQDQAQEADAYRNAMQLLASKLSHVNTIRLEVDVHLDGDLVEYCQLSLCDICQGLRLWGCQVRSLELRHMTLTSAAWSMIGQALPHLSHLRLQSCRIPDTDLAGGPVCVRQ